ncbi:MAG: acyltransferase [Deltaproteobacteria bacterium]|jgi:peptidoglycan/LPS O-acetylase OafA/YrhL|nr:acyltransferase [Deltaproteobacteria bacterium]
MKDNLNSNIRANNKYRPEIDGLRAISIIFVMLYHADFHIFTGGYIGVDIFFVISGYLITGIILDDLQLNKFSFLNFYERRVRRILPPLYFMLIITTIISFYLLLPNELIFYSKSIFYTILFISNILFYNFSGYFNDIARENVLLHTWSLSVEEQFYIFLPLIIFIVLKKFNKYLILIIGTFASISFLASETVLFFNTRLVFYLIPFRAWELLAGSWLAAWPKTRDQQWGTSAPNCFSAVGLILILAPALLYNDQSMFPALAAVPVILGSVLLIKLGLNGFMGKILSTRIFVIIGKLSYPLYLWHWPIFVLFKQYKMSILTTNEKIICLLLAFLMSSISFYLIEKPIRFKLIFKSTKSVFFLMGIFMVIFLTVTLIIFIEKGFIFRLTDQALSYYIETESETPSYQINCPTKYQFGSENLCVLGSELNENPSFVLWGDSHAAAWAHGLDEIAKKYKISGLQYQKDGCLPLFGYDNTYLNEPDKSVCKDFNNNIIELLKVNNIKHVIIAARFASYTGYKSLNPTNSNYIDNEIKKISHDLTYTINILNKLDISVWIVEGVPEQFVSGFNIWARSIITNKDIKNIGINSSIIKNYNKPMEDIINNIINKNENVFLLNIYPSICNETICITGDNFSSYYIDDDHLSIYGSKKFQDTFQPLMETIIQTENN